MSETFAALRLEPFKIPKAEILDLTDIDILYLYLIEHRKAKYLEGEPAKPMDEWTTDEKILHMSTMLKASGVDPETIEAKIQELRGACK